MKPKSTVRSFLAVASSMLLTITSVSATPYYWDSDNGTPGFGSAAGTWTNATLASATGSITYGTPVDGDTVTVNGVTLTKAAVVGAAEFTTITELNALVTAISGVDSTEDGLVVSITAATAGAGGNAITLAETGAMTVSGATLTGGAAPTPSTATGGWSTDSTGSTIISVDPPYPAYVTTTTADDIFFGTSTVPYSAATTITGTVNANSIYQSSGSTIVLGTLPVVNFDATGSWETTNPNTPSIPAITITGAGTSMTWKSLAFSNFNISAMTNNGAARNIIQGPGNIVVNNLGCLGPDGTPLTMAGGSLRILTGYNSYTALHAAHPITWATAPVDTGIDWRPAASTFSVDIELPLGAGSFYSSSAGADRIVKVTVPQTYTGKTYCVSGVLEIGQSNHLGDDAAEFVFGTGTTSGSNGTLKILGTTMNSFGARIMQTTADKGVSFNIDDVGNTFTLDDPLDQGTGGFTKSGAGTITINATRTYTGTTTVSGGTLNFAIPAALPSGAVTVNGAGSLLQFVAHNPSVGVVTLTNGSVTGSGTLTSSAAFVCNPVSPNIFPVGIKLGGTLGLNKTGTGTTTLSLDNSGLSGPVSINGGILNINSTTALGTGAVTLTSGTIDATSGPITLSTNNPVTLGGNFSYTGTNTLNFGTGAVTNSGSRTITLAASGLTFGGDMTNTSNAVQTTTVNGAGFTLALGGGYALSDNGTSRINVITGTGNVTITGAVTNGGTATTSGLTKTGTGTLTLNGNNTYDGLTSLTTAAGTLTLAGDNIDATGGVTLNFATAALNVNHAAALGTGTVTLTAGTINNTSGSAKILTTNNPITFGSFTFGGNNDLTFGSGAITNNGNLTITLNGTASSLAFGGVMSNFISGSQATTVNGAGNTLSLGGYALSNSATLRTCTVQGTGNVTINGAVSGSSFAANETIASILIKSGTGTLTLKGNNIYTGTTTVNTGGCLALVGGSQNSAITVNSGGFLGFTLGSPTTSTKAVTLSAGHKVRITGTPTLASYTLITAASISGTPTLETAIPGYTLSIVGTSLRLVSAAYDTWAGTKGLTAANKAAELDLDNDGRNNLGEFAFNGNPLSGSDNGMIAGLVQDASVPAGNELTLVVAVRDGASFSAAGSPVVQKATIDGLSYTIQGSVDLVTFPGSAVSHAAGPSNTAPVATGLPDLTGTSWEYHTFKLDVSEGLGSKGFLRAKAE